MEANLDFEHLAASPDFAESTTLLIKLTGLVMALNSPTGIFCVTFKQSATSPLCVLIRSTEEGRRRCEACDRRHYEQAARRRKPLLYTCHAGLTDMAVPLFVQDQHVATISSGQVLPERVSKKGFDRIRRRLSWLKVPAAQLRRAYAAAPYMPREKIKQVMRLLELFARQLCESARRIRELESSLEKVEIRRAKELVAARFREPTLSRAVVAAGVGLSSDYFSHIFKRETGEAFCRFMQGRRVAEAKRLLINTLQSVTDICFVCGFNSLTHFNRVFRALEKTSPRGYRIRNRQSRPTKGAVSA